MAGHACDVVSVITDDSRERSLLELATLVCCELAFTLVPEPGGGVRV